MRSIWLRCVALSWLLSSCAVTTPGVEPSRSMSAARASLRPEYRIFYDTLSDYGQWVLIEPLGYVFRPEYNFSDWRPYSYGFWAPSDVYGWVWVSSEPYGWATYHYGRWIHDDFQGWVWIPGAEWGPSWVSWQTTDQYVGWAPLGPGGGWQPQVANTPRSSYLFCSLDQMGSTSPDIMSAAQLGGAVAQAQTVERNVVVDGVRAPAGPSFERIERAIGKPLPRVKIADLLPVLGSDAAAARPQETSKHVADRSIPEAARRAGEQAARETKGFQSRGGWAPARVPVVRPIGFGKVRPRPDVDSTGVEPRGGRR